MRLFLTHFAILLLGIGLGSGTLAMAGSSEKPTGQTAAVSKDLRFLKSKMGLVQSDTKDIRASVHVGDSLNLYSQVIGAKQAIAGIDSKLDMIESELSRHCIKSTASSC